MKYILQLFIISSIFLTQSSYGQKSRMIGLWEAINVDVGEENMTPVAKWFRFKEDGTTESGNGWLKNYDGTWEYDAGKSTFGSNDPLGIKDEAGAFKVSFDKEYMYWEREEDGMPVKVTLKPVNELPMSPADFLKGVWGIESITKDGVSILDQFDPNGKHYLHIRWDRIYRNRNSEGEIFTGYWHIHGHRSEITLLPHTEGKIAESWRIEVNEKELLMVGISDTNRNIERKYVRRNTF
ncbi:hypothetical protein [Cyclobacterium xiamenense]|nr:hypothetical protein [Cyclobacterium xiamenense]